ncbi:hypothetical protein V1517DRAFT_375583 [Lipomyces orientalis]|uniref:Uncharacterized protein n=1 Tax=Lipomyces orientalis TaxID=1233043 RepID=A0ACC3THW4_9ASCO
MDNPNYDDFLRRQQEQQQQQQQQTDQPQPPQHQQQLPPQLYSTSMSGFVPQYTDPESQMLRAGENYLSDSHFQSFFGSYGGSQSPPVAQQGQPYGAFTAQLPSNSFGLRPQMSQHVSVAPQPLSQYSFMAPVTPAYYHPQQPPQPQHGDNVSSPTSSSQTPQQSHITLPSPQPQPQPHRPSPQLQLDQTQFYGSLNGATQQQQYAPVSAYQQLEPQVRTPYFTSFLNGERSSQHLSPQIYNEYRDSPGAVLGNVAAASVSPEVNNASAISSISPADVSLPALNLPQAGNGPAVPHWPLPPMPPSVASQSADVVKAEKKPTKRSATTTPTDRPPKKKTTKKMTATIAPTAVARSQTVPASMDTSSGLVQQVQPTVEMGQGLVPKVTAFQPQPQLSAPPASPPVPEEPKELPILHEKDPVTALRLRVATAFRNLMDDMRLLTERLVEIMLSIPEEAYGTTTKFDLREVYLSQLTMSTGSTKDIWNALSENNLCLARIRNWLVNDYKAKRFESAKPVLVALARMPISLEQLKRVKMEKVLLFYEGKGNAACKEIARKILSRAKNVEENDGSSGKPESLRKGADPADGKTVPDAKKAQIPRANVLSGFTIPKKSSTSTTPKAPSGSTTANAIKAERPSGNTSFFQSLQKKPAAAAKSISPKPAEEKKPVTSSQPSTPVPAASQPRISSLFTSFRTGPKSEDTSEKSTPEPVRPKKKRKTVSWRSEADLVQVRYFESDPSERALNVSDAVHERYRNARELDISEGRAAFKKGQHIEEIEYEVEEDEKIPWYTPIGSDINFVKCDRFSSNELEKNIFRHGGGKQPDSAEARIQKERESNVLLAMYFTDADIPPSPSEPENTADLGSDESPAMKEIPVPQSTRLAWTMLLVNNGTSQYPIPVSSISAAAAAPAPAVPLTQSAQSSTSPQGFAALQALLPILAQAQARPLQAQAPQSKAQPQIPDLTALAAMLQAAGGLYGSGTTAANGSSS